MKQDVRAFVELAIQIKGSQAKLAADMGCSQQQISYLLRAKRVSAEMARSLDEVTDGVVSKHSLRPDIFGEQQTISPMPNSVDALEDRQPAEKVSFSPSGCEASASSSE